MSGLAPRARESIVRPRPLSGVVVRPLNFAVRRHHAHIPLFPRWVLALGRLPDIGPAILSPLPERYVRGNGRVHITVAGDLGVQFMGWCFEGRLHPGGRATDFSVDLCRAGRSSDHSEMEVLVTSGALMVPSNNRWRGP